MDGDRNILGICGKVGETRRWRKWGNEMFKRIGFDGNTGHIVREWREMKKTVKGRS